MKLLSKLASILLYAKSEGASWMQNEAVFSNHWPSRPFEKFQYRSLHFLHISTQKNTSHNCKKCHKLDIPMNICLHTNINLRPAFANANSLSVSMQDNWSCQLLSDSPSVMLEPLLKHNQYIKSHPIQNQFLFSNYYKLFQIFSTVTHQSHIKKKKNAQICKTVWKLFGNSIVLYVHKLH